MPKEAQVRDEDSQEGIETAITKFRPGDPYVVALA
jgi:hypothetical protein